MPDKRRVRGSHQGPTAEDDDKAPSRPRDGKVGKTWAQTAGRAETGAQVDGRARSSARYAAAWGVSRWPPPPATWPPSGRSAPEPRLGACTRAQASSRGSSTRAPREIEEMTTVLVKERKEIEDRLSAAASRSRGCQLVVPRPTADRTLEHGSNRVEPTAMPHMPPRNCRHPLERHQEGPEGSGQSAQRRRGHRSSIVVGGGWRCASGGGVARVLARSRWWGLESALRDAVQGVTGRKIVRSSRVVRLRRGGFER